MGLLSGLSTDSSIAAEKDVVGGGFAPLPSEIYASKLTLAYLLKSQGGALGLHITAETPDGEQIRESIYVTSGDAKGNKNYYLDNKGDKQYLPGFSLANSLALLTVGKEINELETEESVLNIYNATAQKEVPTKVELLRVLMDQEVYAALQHQVVDKNIKNADGKYVPTGETREQNEIVKFFRMKDKMTVAEVLAQATEATFFEAWRDKWVGQSRNTVKGAPSGVAGAPNAAAGAPGANQAPAAAAPSSLFANNA